MKKTLSVILLVMILSFSFVFAQTETEEVELPDQLVMPGDGLYGLDRAMERIRYTLTLGSENKARVRLEIAEERLAELEQLPEEDQGTFGKELAEEHMEQLELARQEGSQIQNMNREREFNEILQEEAGKSMEVLERVMNRFRNDDNPDNDNALQGLQNALDGSQTVKTQARNRNGDIEQIQNMPEGVGNGNGAGQ